MSEHPPKTRRSIRLASFDYRTPGAYYITIVAHDRQPLLGTIVDGMTALSALGHVVDGEWRRTATQRDNVELDQYVVMPDHLHALLWILPDGREDDSDPTNPVPAQGRRFGVMPKDSLSSIVRSFKSAATRTVNAERGTPSATFWQRGFFERVVRNERELDLVRRYIVDNPARWEVDREVRDHPWPFD